MPDIDALSRQARGGVGKSVAEVCDEMRILLNAIISFAEVIMEERFGPVGDERYKGYLRDIHISGEHIMGLLNDLRDVAKIGAGQVGHGAGVDDAGRDEPDSAYRRLESEIIESVGATLDRMIDRADRTSGELDCLIRRLSETARSQRPAA